MRVTFKKAVPAFDGRMMYSPSSPFASSEIAFARDQFYVLGVGLAV